MQSYPRLRPRPLACDYHPCLEILCSVLSGRFYPTASLSSDPCYLFLPLQAAAVGNSFTRLVAVSRSLSHIQIHTSCWRCLANVFLLGLEDSESNTASKSPRALPGQPLSSQLCPHRCNGLTRLTHPAVSISFIASFGHSKCSLNKDLS